MSHAIDVSAITNLRVTNPKAVQDALKNRARRSEVAPDGKLFLVAADHPARGALGATGNPMAMANRAELLGRMVTALEQPGVDGVLGSPDILEDLAVLGALENKVVIGTSNRGGIQGATWELDDRLTSYDAKHAVDFGLDGVKMLLRIEATDRGVAKTIEDCAQLVTDLADNKLMAMVEPLPYRTRPEGGVELLKDNDQLIRVTTIGAALGASSAYTWLKLPAWSDPETMAAASTLPVLLLGGDPGPDLDATLATWAKALAQPTVRGLTIGRALLYPADGDVAGAVRRAATLVRPQN